MRSVPVLKSIDFVVVTVLALRPYKMAFGACFASVVQRVPE